METCTPPDPNKRTKRDREEALEFLMLLTEKSKIKGITYADGNKKW